MHIDNINSSYTSILKQLKQSPGQEQALDSLIDLETKVAEGLFHVLQERYQKNRQETNIYSQFIAGSQKRDRIEALVMQKTTGNKLSITDLTNLFLKKIYEILHADTDMLTKIKQLKIAHIDTKDIVLPPDYEKEIITGSGKGFETGEGFDKLGLLIDGVLRPNGIYTDDLLIITGKIRPEMMRKQSYLCISIPRINKTIFINNQYGEATFIYSGIMEYEWFTKLGKQALSNFLLKIKFSAVRQEERKKRMIYELFNKNDQSGNNTDLVIGDKVNVKKLKDGLDTEIRRAKIISRYNGLSKEDQKKVVGSILVYRNWAKDKENIPKSYHGLLSILGGNTKCVAGGYVAALLKSKEEGEKYFDRWEKEKNKTEKETRAEFISLYNGLPKEDKKEITKNSSVYNKRAETKNNIPKSYWGLVSVLGGNTECSEGGYIAALLESKEAGEKYFKNWEENQNKTNEEVITEFLPLYNGLSKEDQKVLISSANTYRSRAKDKENMPKSYGGLVSILGGNTKCAKGGYIAALLKSKEEGEKYFRNWENYINKTEIKRRAEFISLYNGLSKENQKKVVGGSGPYQDRAKGNKDIPKSYGGLISLLGGKIRCGDGQYLRESGYILALLESEEKGEKYFKNWEKSKNKTEEEIRNRFILLYNGLSKEDQRNLGRCNLAYWNRAKDKKNMPKTYHGVISMLGGNTKCVTGSYVTALLKSKEEGEKYFERWEEYKNKTWEETRDGFVLFYNRLSKEEQEKVVGGSTTYQNRAKGKKNTPESYGGLISLLGGKTRYPGGGKITEGGYITALLKSKELGEKYLKNWEEKKNRTENQLRAVFISVYNGLSEEDQEIIVGNSITYRNRAKNKENIPKSFGGVISLLGGNIKCIRGGYIAALLKSKEEGEAYFKKWEKKKNKTEKEIRSEFTSLYNGLSKEDQKKITSSSISYVSRAKDKENVPKSYQGLIFILGGNIKCTKGEYIAALLESKEKGEEYLKNRLDKKN